MAPAIGSGEEKSDFVSAFLALSPYVSASFIFSTFAAPVRPRDIGIPLFEFDVDAEDEVVRTLLGRLLLLLTRADEEADDDLPTPGLDPNSAFLLLSALRLYAILQMF
jgi:hypothetical protein